MEPRGAWRAFQTHTGECVHAQVRVLAACGISLLYRSFILGLQVHHAHSLIAYGVHADELLTLLHRSFFLGLQVPMRTCTLDNMRARAHLSRAARAHLSS